MKPMLGTDRSAGLRWLIGLLLHVALLIAAVAAAGALAGAPGASEAVAALGWLLMAAVVYAFASVQIGFLAHDLEHGQVPLSRRARDALGLVCWNLLLGISLRWWREKHRTHHRHTHIDGHDPDLYAMFVYAPDKARALNGPRRWFVACQDVLFWPIAACARLYFQGLSLLAALRMPSRVRALELATLCAHHALLWGACWTTLGPRAVPFLLLGQWLSGLYMALSFAPNHLGMPLAQAAGSGRRWQIEHTRNIRTNRLGTYLLGGLDLQIEHHLYPTMSRRDLRAMQPQVERECREAGIAYRRVGMFAALVEVQTSLRAVARAARTQ